MTSTGKMSKKDARERLKKQGYVLPSLRAKAKLWVSRWSSKRSSTALGDDTRWWLKRYYVCQGPSLLCRLRLRKFIFRVIWESVRIIFNIESFVLKSELNFQSTSRLYSLDKTIILHTLISITVSIIFDHIINKYCCVDLKFLSQRQIRQ